MSLLEITARCERINLSWASGIWRVVVVLNNGVIWAGSGQDLETICERIPTLQAVST